MAENGLPHRPKRVWLYWLKRARPKCAYLLLELSIDCGISPRHLFLKCVVGAEWTSFEDCMKMEFNIHEQIVNLTTFI